jgi:biotin-(acetyl-CoA carboxylase) ligase
MKVYTDSKEFADLMIPGTNWSACLSTGVASEIGQVIAAVFGARQVFEAEVQGGQRWQCLLATESSVRSQYDTLIELRRQERQLPDGLLCLSGAGKGLHGLRNRPWAAEAGNIHLSVFLTPEKAGVHSGIPFMVLAAVSVVETIDTVTGLEGKAGIKWVNDIVIAGAKVAGVLAYTEGAGQAIGSAVLGVGLNVETRPTVVGTPFVPRVGSLRDFVADPSACTLGSVLGGLLDALDRNCELLLDGRAGELIDRYRERSVVVGRDVTVCVDDDSSPPETIASGTVEHIGDNLELYLRGSDKPVTRGRLILESAEL